MIEEADLEEEEENKAKAPKKTFAGMKTDFHIKNQQSKLYSLKNKNTSSGGNKKVTES
jgi:hypothetical protein